MIGPGAVGGTIATHLATARHEVVLAARTPRTRIEVETPEGVIGASFSTIVDPTKGVGAGYDWILVCTKAYDLAPTAKWLTALRGAHTPVAVLQNGVEHRERFAAHVPASQILPVVVECSAERLAPERIRQRNRARLVVPSGDLGGRFVALFDRTGVEVSQTSDWVSAAWRKLCLNVAGTVPALLARTNAVARHEGAARVIRALVTECIAVGRAEGAVLEDALVDEVVTRMSRSDTTNSLTADRMAGRPMEIDARNGVLARLGAKHGIATPVNALMVALLEAVQA